MLLLVVVLLCCQAQSHEAAKAEPQSPHGSGLADSTTPGYPTLTKEPHERQGPPSVHSDHSDASAISASRRHEESPEERRNDGTASKQSGSQTHELETQMEPAPLSITETHNRPPEKEGPGKHHAFQVYENEERNEDQGPKKSSFGEDGSRRNSGNHNTEERRKAMIHTRKDFELQETRADRLNHGILEVISGENSSKTIVQDSEDTSHEQSANSNDIGNEVDRFYRIIQNERGQVRTHSDGLKLFNFREVDESSRSEDRKAIKLESEKMENQPLKTLNPEAGGNVSYNAWPKAGKLDTLSHAKRIPLMNNPLGAPVLERNHTKYTDEYNMHGINTHSKIRKRRRDPGPGIPLNYTLDGIARKTLMMSDCICEYCNPERKYRGYYQNRENVLFSKKVDVSSNSDEACKVTDGFERNTYILPGHSEAVGCFVSKVHDIMPWMQIDIGRVITFKRFDLNLRSNRNPYKVLENLKQECHHLASLFFSVDGRRCFSYQNYEKFKCPFIISHVYMECEAPLTGRYFRFERYQIGGINEQHEEDSFYRLVICSVKIHICKKGYYGVLRTNCQKCPEDCLYPCDNYYGCVEVTYNVAILKPVTQESAGIGSPNNVNDGKVYYQGGRQCSIMHNAGSSQASWWKVNLLGLHRISAFAVTARYDCCASSSLENAKLIVAIGGEVRLNPLWYELCGTIGSRVAARERVEVICPQLLPGDWAMIVRQGVPGQFGFCEIEVFGHRINLQTAFGRCYPRWTTYIICDGDNICEQTTCRTKVLRPCHDKLQCRAGAVCDSGKCKWELNHVCTQNKDGNECRSGTFCDPESDKCKIQLNHACEYSLQCPFLAICDVFKRCGLKVGFSCQRSSDCTAGARCVQNTCICNTNVGKHVDDHCVPNAGRTGAHCDDNPDCNDGICTDNVCSCGQDKTPFAQEFSCMLKTGASCSKSSECNVGLVCEDAKCKLEAGTSCYGNENSCKSGLTCESDICKIKPGENCTNLEGTCNSGAFCKSGTCYIGNGGNCTTYESFCASGLCRKGICRIRNGDACTEQTAKFCLESSFCEYNHVCKIGFGELCHANKECETGFLCYARNASGVKNCRLPMGKSGCKHDDDCATGAICDRFHECRIPKGGDCHSLPNMCLHGALCSDGQCQCNSEVTRTTTERCDALEKKVGGHCDDDKDKGVTSCDDPMASCINNTCRCQSSFVPDSVSLECRKGPGSLCGTKGIGCITGAVCDATSVCAVDVGNSCAGDRNGNCRIGSVCDIDEVCHLDFDQNCANYTDYCRNNTACDTLKRCKRMPGNICTRNDDCVAGASCNESYVCVCTEGVSKQVGISCVPVDSIVGGKCGNGDTCEDQFAVCDHDSGNCECQEGYTADPSRLTCAKMVNVECKADEECVTGLICDPAAGRCVISVGQMCDGKRHFCQPGSVCDYNYVCKLDLKGNCSGTNTIYCRSGTFCDFRDLCGRGVGDYCNGSLTGDADECIAGAFCNASQCTCDPTISTASGALCEPNKGRYRGGCDLECDVPNSQCVEGICACQPAFHSDRRFLCVGKSVSNESGFSDLLYMIIILAAALVTAIAAGMLFALRRHRNRARAAIMAEGAEELRKIQQIKNTLDDLDEPSRETPSGAEDPSESGDSSVAEQSPGAEHSEEQPRLDSEEQGVRGEHAEQLPGNEAEPVPEASPAEDQQAS